MAKKGERKAQKRISANKLTRIRRKEKTWVFKSRPGPHSGQKSDPLGVLIRDILEIAKTGKETRLILNSGNARVDGRVRKKPQFPVGLFDVISIGASGKGKESESAEFLKHYRAVLDASGRLGLKEIGGQSAGMKLCKVLGKKAFSKGVFQLHTNDGRSFMEKNNGIKPGDTIELGLPEQEVKKHYRLEKGNIVFVIAGKRIGSIGKITEVIPGTMARERIVVLAPEEGKDFQTAERNVFVVGKEKQAIEVSME